MKKFDKVRPMIDRDEYMFVNNVYDNWKIFANNLFFIFSIECRCYKSLK